MTGSRHRSWQIGAWRQRAAIATLAATVALAACGGARPSPVAAPPPHEATAWELALDSVRTLVAADRHAVADSVLQRFVARHLGTPAGAEASFWRAMLALDPANEGSSPREALVAIDGYLAGGISQPRYLEALLLRRTAEALEGALRPPAPNVTVTTTLPPDSLPRFRAAQDTIRQLRLELEKTNAELERIRRRIRP